MGVHPPLLAALLLLAPVSAACGGTTKSEPTQRDATEITRSVSNIVESCRAAESGFVAGVEEQSLQRDVDALLRLSNHVLADAEYRIEGLPPDLATTTLSKQLRLATSILDRCAPSLKEKLGRATDE